MTVFTCKELITASLAMREQAEKDDRYAKDAETQEERQKWIAYAAESIALANKLQAAAMTAPNPKP